jgi:hypothetical protein
VSELKVEHFSELDVEEDRLIQMGHGRVVEWELTRDLFHEDEVGVVV